MHELNNIFMDKTTTSPWSSPFFLSPFNSLCSSLHACPPEWCFHVVTSFFFNATGFYRSVSLLARICQEVLIGSSLNASCTDFEPTVEVKLFKALLSSERSNLSRGGSCFYLSTYRNLLLINTSVNLLCYSDTSRAEGRIHFESL